MSAKRITEIRFRIMKTEGSDDGMDMIRMNFIIGLTVLLIGLLACLLGIIQKKRQIHSDMRFPK